MNAPTVAVVLSGTGVYDGSEVHEAAAALAGITRAGADVQCFAPDVPQMHVVDHTKGAPADGDTRNTLVESARIARGHIKPLSALNSSAADAVIFPGGFGAAKNLSDFAVNGANMSVTEETARVLIDFHSAKKPIGLCCIAPILAAKVLGNQGVSLTLGRADDGSGKWPYAGSIDAAKSMGANMVEKSVDEILIDEKNKIVTTPAFMYEGKFHEIQDGVGKMVNAVMTLIK
ncbi:Class I glutamine amidotransferase-like [Trinorchestia longiramus]|nr:Class I glutamine amidotransferase-like [Trinorchestia longiramus]